VRLEGAHGDEPLVVLAIVADDATRELMPHVLPNDRLMIAGDLAEGMACVESEPPDIAFVDVTIEGGGGLALVHHIKAVAPEVTVYALATAAGLEAGAHAVALGGAGLMMLPLGGDEVLSAVAQVKMRRMERALIVRLEHAAQDSARAAGWTARLAELVDAPDRTSAAQQLADVMIESTGAKGCAVYLSIGESGADCVRFGASPTLPATPASATEGEILQHARAHELVAVPLTTRTLRTGVVLLQGAEGGPRIDGLLKVLATQAAAAMALFLERERTGGGGTIKDPSSSAYSFAYYVDVAGREIDKARRHGRRFAIATIVLEPRAAADALSPAEVADHLLNAVRDTDILARVDENEFHLLMPETDGLGAHACRRRVLARVNVGDRRGALLPAGLLVGVATFPHDGPDLAQLLRKARRRAEQTKDSVVRTLRPGLANAADVLDALEASLEGSPPGRADASGARKLEIAIPEAAALASAVTSDALRGGASFFVVAHHMGLSLGAAVRSSLGAPRENVVVHALDLSAAPRCKDLEALAVVAEHGAYALLARSEGHVLRGVHAADPLLSDFIAERLGRTAGLRVFT
jgi:ActR/RegA family two-component response regulator